MLFAMKERLTLLLLMLANVAKVRTGKWQSSVTGTSIAYTTSKAIGEAATDATGK